MADPNVWIALLFYQVKKLAADVCVFSMISFLKKERKEKWNRGREG